MMYSKIEAAVMFKNCETIQEVEKAVAIFGYLQTVHGHQIPTYVNRYAHLRYRNLIK